MSTSTDPNLPRVPVFDTMLARTVLLYDQRLEEYCRMRCFCPKTEDEYMVADLEEAIIRMRFTFVPEITPEVFPTATASPRPSAEPDTPWWKGLPWPKQTGNQKLPSYYYGSTFQCTRTTSQRLQCSCRRSHVGKGRIQPIRTPQRVAISPFS